MVRLIILILLFNLMAHNVLCQYPTELNPLEWRWIASTVDGNEHFQQYTHKNKTYVGSSSILVWSRIEIKKQIKSTKGKKVNKKDGYQLELVEYFCDDRKYRVVQRVNYNNKGLVIDTFEREFGDQLYPIPGSASDVLLNTACKMIGQ